MTDQNSSPRIAALQELEAALDEHRRTQAHAGAHRRAPLARAGRPDLGSAAARLAAAVQPLVSVRPPPSGGAQAHASRVAGVVAVVLVGGGALWWRLSSGPIMLDLATPWLTSAIEQNLGSRYRVEVGGTQLERDAQGHTALRLRDIVLRDASGAPVAIAPKAEVGISGTSLLFASPRAKSIRLVDANMTIRIDADGRVNVLVGGERPFFTTAPRCRARAPRAAAARPPAGTAAAGAAEAAPGAFSLQAMAERGMATNFAALLGWIDRLGELELNGGDADTGGFDGHALTEIGITNGSLTIDDRRNGQDWKFKQISLRLSRPKSGGGASSACCRRARSGRGW